MQVTWCSPSQFHANHRRQATNENGCDKQSWNPNIPQKRFDRMHIVNRSVSSFAYKLISCRYNVNVFPLCYGLKVDFVYVAWGGANWVFIGNSYPLVTVTGRTSYTTFKSKCITFWILNNRWKLQISHPIAWTGHNGCPINDHACSRTHLHRQENSDLPGSISLPCLG